jgi:hypothetical protein
MITINLVGDKITGVCNGTVYSVTYSQSKYDEMKAIYDTFQQVETMADAKELMKKFDAIAVESLKEKVETKSDHLFYNEKTGKFYLRSGDKISSVPMPKRLADDILDAAEKQLPVEPIVKFWTRLLRNPNIKNRKDAEKWTDSVVEYVTRLFVSPVLKDKYLEEGYSEEVAIKLATVRQTPFTMEGLVCTKKVVTPLYDRSMYKYVLDENGESKRVLRDVVEVSIDEDTGKVDKTIKYSEDWVFQPYIMGTGGDAFHCGSDDKVGHIIRVGQEMWLDSWNQVNCDFSAAGVKGIHTGNQDYINGYEKSDNVTLNCFVDPSEIGAVACYDQVLRVKALFPHSIKDREDDNKNLYHSSTYAAMKDLEYQKAIEEVIQKFTEKAEKLKQQVDKEKNEIELSM